MRQRLAVLGQIGNLVPANEVVGEDAPIHSIDPEPSMSALGQTVAVELDSQWRAWWRLWQGHKRQAEELEQILLADFTPVVDALVSAAETEIAGPLRLKLPPPPPPVITTVALALEVA